MNNYQKDLKDAEKRAKRNDSKKYAQLQQMLRKIGK